MLIFEGEWLLLDAKEQMELLITQMTNLVDELEDEKKGCASSLELCGHQMDLVESRIALLMDQLKSLHGSITSDPDMVKLCGIHNQVSLFLFKSKWCLIRRSIVLF